QGHVEEAGPREGSFHEFSESLDFDAPAPATSSSDWLRNGRWYTQQSVVYMQRTPDAKNDLTLARDLASAPLPRQTAALNIDDLGWQPGMRSTIGKFLGRDAKNRDHAVEFTFLGLTHWRASGGLFAVNPGSIFSTLDFTNNVPAYNGSNAQTYQE